MDARAGLLLALARPIAHRGWHGIAPVAVAAAPSRLLEVAAGPTRRQ